MDGLNGDTLFRFELPSEKLNKFVLLHSLQETISNTVFKQHPHGLLPLPIQLLSSITAETNYSTATDKNRAFQAKKMPEWMGDYKTLLCFSVTGVFSSTLINARVFQIV